MGPGRSARQDLRGARPVELREILCRVLSPGRFDYWHWYGGPAGRSAAVVVCGTGPERRWASGGLLADRMVETGRLLWANRPSLRQPSARWAGRDPELAAGWWLVGAPYPGHSVSNVCWTGAGSAQAGPRARGGPGGARRRGPGRGPLNPNWVGIGRHDRRSWRGLKFGCVEKVELAGSLFRRRSAATLSS
jgi:hypothetical protein